MYQYDNYCVGCFYPCNFLYMIDHTRTSCVYFFGEILYNLTNMLYIYRRQYNVSNFER